jgi:predicted outer membrane protein
MHRSIVCLGSIAAALLASTTAPAAPAPPPPPPPPPPPRDFTLQAAQSDNYEIAAAQTAMTQSRTAPVRSFAQEMIRDHTHSSQALPQRSLPGCRRRPTP